VKTASERPSVWNGIVTLVAMLYLSNFSIGVLVAVYNPTLASSAAVLGFVLVLVWAFLVCDLIKQISLFFRKPAK
jgi:hypothetical protein